MESEVVVNELFPDWFGMNWGAMAEAPLVGIQGESTAPVQIISPRELRVHFFEYMEPDACSCDTQKLAEALADILNKKAPLPDGAQYVAGYYENAYKYETVQLVPFLECGHFIMLSNKRKEYRDSCAIDKGPDKNITVVLGNVTITNIK